MRQFALQALIDERSLWDVMRYLEGVRAQGIVTRPYYVEAPQPEEQQQLAAPDIGARLARLPTTGKAAEARAAILAALKDGGTVTSAALSAKNGLDQRKYTQIFAQLATAGVIKRVGVGEYALADAATSAAPPRAHGNARSQVRATIVAMLQTQTQITTKDVRARVSSKASAVHAMLFVLTQGGYLKRVGAGTYAKGKKELTP